MTKHEFEKSLTKEQKDFHWQAVKECMEREDHYYQECVRLRKEITLLICSLNITPLGDTDKLCEMLRKIRRELYEDRQRAKQKRKDAHYRPGRAESGRETITTETGLAMLRSGEIQMDGMARLRNGDIFMNRRSSNRPETNGEG